MCRIRPIPIMNDRNSTLRGSGACSKSWMILIPVSMRCRWKISICRTTRRPTPISYSETQTSHREKRLCEASADACFDNWIHFGKDANPCKRFTHRGQEPFSEVFLPRFIVDCGIEHLGSGVGMEANGLHPSNAYPCSNTACASSNPTRASSISRQRLRISSVHSALSPGAGSLSKLSISFSANSARASTGGPKAAAIVVSTLVCISITYHILLRRSIAY